MTPQKPYLNLGCGRVILPAPKPTHHALIPDGVHSYALWHNVDIIASEGVDETVDVFRYPFPWSDNAFDGALLTHLVEHIPHEIRVAYPSPRPFYDDENWVENYLYKFFEAEDLRIHEASRFPDGFYAFFAELHRVLTPGALAHILVPYAFSTGAMQDPTHTRYLVPETFGYLVPNPNAVFVLPEGGAWASEGTVFGSTRYAAPYQDDAEQLDYRAKTNWNIASEFYIRLRVVK